MAETNHSNQKLHTDEEAQASVEREESAREEELLEPMAKPPMPKNTKWLIVGLLVAVLVLGGGIALYYYNQTIAPAKAAEELEYTNSLTNAFNEYVAAQEDYFAALNNYFNAFTENDPLTHTFTDEDVHAIKGATDMFEQRAGAAMDMLVAIEPPASKKKAHQEVVAATKDIKEKVIPVSVKTQRAIKKGMTLKDFVEQSEALAQAENDTALKAFATLQEALSNAGVDMGGSEQQQSTETTQSGN